MLTIYVVIAGPAEGATVEYHRFWDNPNSAMACFKDMTKVYPQAELTQWVPQGDGSFVVSVLHTWSK